MTPEHIDYIAKLEALQENTPSFEDLVSTLHGSFVQYHMNQGFAVGYGLLHEDDCAVQKMFFSQQAEFPEHSHGEHEYFVILSGSGKVLIGEKETSFEPLDCIVIEPGQKHSWKFETNTKLIALTVPASKGFPNGPG